MTNLTFSRIAVAAAALAVAFPLAASPASAQNLFDLLFGGGNRAGRLAEPPPEERPKPRVVAPKVSGPSYYTYKPEPLGRVDFSPIVEALAEKASASADITGSITVSRNPHVDTPAKPMTAGPTDSEGRFREALSALDGFDLVVEKDIGAGIAAYYAKNPDFLWVTEHGQNDRAKEALRVLGEAGSFGLDETDYHVAVPAAYFSMKDTSERLRTLMRFEMTLTAHALRYVRDANQGRVDPNKISGYHDFPKKSVNYARTLGALARTHDVRRYLESRHPQNDEYRVLRVELEALRASARNEIVVDPDTFVRPGGTHAEFPKILKIIDRDADEAMRDEYGALLARHMGSEIYDQELVPLIKAAQKARDLNPDGVIGPRTVGAIAGDSKAARIEKVLMSLERLRWHPSDLGDPRVVINASAFTATLTENGEDTLSMRAVVGTRSNQTSFFHDEIEHVVFNPYWGVPRSILVNEMLPKLYSDPGYLDRAGYEVTNRRGQRVSSASVNWGAYGANIPFDVRQRPGSSNALGELKIMFPNKHAIYMHDTPAKHLFERDTRAYSHGCVRLQDPRGMAAAVLRWQRDRIAARLAEGHSEQETPRKIPVYVGYFTAWPDRKGVVNYSGDVYGRDDRLKTALDKVDEMRAASS